MKKSFYLFIFFFGLMSATKSQPGKEKEVAAAVEILRKAMIDANKQQLESITASELSYGHSTGKIEDKAAFVEALVSGRNDFLTMELSDQTIKIAGNTALVRFNLSANTSDNGKPGTAKLAVLLVWQKQQGNWKLLARQAVKI